MKYLRAIIIFLILVSIGIGVFYGYTQIVSTKPSAVSTNNSEETPRPVITASESGQGKVVSKFLEYTTQDSKKLGKTIAIQGVFQAADNGTKVINGITYNYIIGVLAGDGSLASVWLTTSEYEQIKSVVTSYGKHGEHVTITLVGDVVNFTTERKEKLNL